MVGSIGESLPNDEIAAPMRLMAFAVLDAWR